jgi:hypothetical protein
LGLLLLHPGMLMLPLLPRAAHCGPDVPVKAQ